ncbi:hypothetical protein BDN72DRAFT_865638 [Pluteus cervinus]|uniref:Uncharacterized protein n=1 Tax=Pluteus cervinus TaxID=181527 RepID=A0ACD2ZZI1_9AGAR|nr:hypothetical protein BDN72DRAFT_865638 [Pluteus cervinus]
MPSTVPNVWAVEGYEANGVWSSWPQIMTLGTHSVSSPWDNRLKQEPQVDVEYYTKSGSLTAVVLGRGTRKLSIHPVNRDIRMVPVIVLSIIDFQNKLNVIVRMKDAKAESQSHPQYHIQSPPLNLQRWTCAPSPTLQISTTRLLMNVISYETLKKFFPCEPWRVRANPSTATRL